MEFSRLARTPDFIEELSRSVRAILLHRFPGLSPQDLEDIEQEVKLKIWKMAAGGKNIRYFRSYLWKTVYTTALDVLDGRLDQLLEEERGAPEGLDSSAESSEGVLTLRAAIAELPPGRKQVVNLHLDGLGLEESATRLGWSTNRVRHLFYRARAELKRKLAGPASSKAALPAETNDD